MKDQILYNEETGKWELLSQRADSYIAVDNNRNFLVADKLETAEAFLHESGVGGKIYGLTHYQHKDEMLPQSKFYKEVTC